MKSLRKSLTIIMICILTLTGCWDQKIFEQVGLILTVGIEKTDNNKILLSYTYPVIGGSIDDAVGLDSVATNIIRGGRELIRYRAPRNMEGGKVQQVLISDELAKLGIHDLLEIFQRDVTLPAISYIVIVEGSPKELIVEGSKLKDKPRISFYTYQLLENNVKLSNIPNTKVFDFDINFFAPGLDPVTPMIKFKKDYIEITGSALFSEDKMVGKLNQKQTIVLLGIMGQTKNTDFVYEDPSLKTENKVKYGLAITLRKPKRKISFDFDEEGKPIIDISLKYECVLDEYKWNKTDEAEEQKKLEEELSKHIESLCNETVKVLQEVNSDPIGFGNMVRAKYYDYWKSIEWKEMYPEAKIKVDVKVEIVKEGIIK